MYTTHIPIYIYMYVLLLHSLNELKSFLHGIEPPIIIIITITTIMNITTIIIIIITITIIIIIIITNTGHCGCHPPPLAL